jgi:hypothetical protein
MKARRASLLACGCYVRTGELIVKPDGGRWSCLPCHLARPSPNPEGEPVTTKHAQPAPADQRAVIACAKAVLASNPAAAHKAASPPGTCPACVVIAAVQLGFALCASLTDSFPFVTDELHARLAELVEHAAAELAAAPN